MKYEHNMEEGKCIHCGATDVASKMCIFNGKEVFVGATIEGVREPFKSFMDDLDFVRTRHAELFPAKGQLDASIA